MIASSFSETGVNYAVPFMCKKRNSRNSKSFKSFVDIYFYLFFNSCYLPEIGFGLSASTFLASLKRFVCRRGKPAELGSDCATNATGTSKA